jgi:hypothetical protein
MIKHLGIILFLTLSVTISNAQSFFILDSINHSGNFSNMVEFNKTTFLANTLNKTITNDWQSCFTWINKQTGITQKNRTFNYSDSTKAYFFSKMIKYNDLFIVAGIDEKDSFIYIAALDSNLQLIHYFKTDSLVYDYLIDIKCTNDNLIITATTDSFNVILNMSLPGFAVSGLLYVKRTNNGETPITTHYRIKDSCYYMVTQGGPRDSVPITQNESFFYLWKISPEGKYTNTIGLFPIIFKGDTSLQFVFERWPSFVDVNDSLFYISALCHKQKGGFIDIQPLIIMFNYNSLKMLKWNISLNNDLRESNISYQSIGFSNSSIQYINNKIYQLTMDNWYQKFRVQEYGLDLSQHKEYTIPMPMPDSFYLYSSVGFLINVEHFVTWGNVSRKGKGYHYVYTTSLPNTAVSEITANNIFSVYPNPAQHNLTIDLNQNLSYSIVLKDLSAKAVLTQTNIQGKSTLTLPGLNSGIYILEIISDEGIQRKKVLISQ